MRTASNLAQRGAKHNHDYRKNNTLLMQTTLLGRKTLQILSKQLIPYDSMHLNECQYRYKRFNCFIIIGRL